MALVKFTDDLDRIIVGRGESFIPALENTGHYPDQTEAFRDLGARVANELVEGIIAQEGSFDEWGSPEIVENAVSWLANQDPPLLLPDSAYFFEGAKTVIDVINGQGLSNV